MLCIGNFRPPICRVHRAIYCGAFLIRNISERLFVRFMEASPSSADDESVSHHVLRPGELQLPAWTAGDLVPNIGTAMQRVANNSIVLTQLTHHDWAAVGIVIRLHLALQLLLLP